MSILFVYIIVLIIIIKTFIKHYFFKLLIMLKGHKPHELVLLQTIILHFINLNNLITKN